MNNVTPHQTSPQPDTPSRSKAPLMITAIVGGVLVLGAIGGATIAGIYALNSDSPSAQRLTADATDITALDIHVSAANFEVRFDSLASPDADATLETTEGRQNWTLERRGDSLIVDTERSFFDWGWNFFGGGADQHVVLTLPDSLRASLIDADLTLSAGSLRADGDFGELDLEVSAGSMRIDGSARDVQASVSAGEAHVKLADVSEFAFEVSAGDLTVDLSGTAPRLVHGSVSAGEAIIALPDEVYQVSTEASAGEIRNGLQTASNSPRVVKVEVSAGKITLQPTQ